jgi:predicted dehydrogenase
MNPVRIGMIGCGGHARWHISNLCKVADARVAALADPNPAQIQRTQAMFPALAKVPAFSDFHAMLAQAELDAVVICTPHTQHVDQVIDAFGRGLHVLVEKPMVTSVEDAHRVLDAHRKAPGKVGAIGYQRHTQPEFIRLRQEIASGKWGAVTYLAALQCQEWKRLTKGTWRQDPQLSGGGQLNDSGSHLIDILLWVTGLRPASVSAVIDNLGTPVDINSSLSIRFAGGAMASVAIVGDAPSGTRRSPCGARRGCSWFGTATCASWRQTGRSRSSSGSRAEATRIGTSSMRSSAGRRSPRRWSAASG